MIVRVRVLGLFFTALPLAFGILAGGATAGPPAIGVEVRFETDDITSLWGAAPRTQAVQKRSGEGLARLFREIFPYWRFESRHASTRLLFRIMPGLQNNTIIRVVAYVRGLRARKWDVDWLSAVDIGNGRLSDPQEVPAVLRQGVEVAVIGRHETTLFEWLKEEVPVADGGQWRGQPSVPQAVLALPYATFGLVGASRFEVLVKPASGPGPAEKLKVMGLSLSATYQSVDGIAPPFDALVVAPRSRELLAGQEDPLDVPGRAALHDLALHHIFLRERRRSNDPDQLLALEDR